MPTFIQDKNQLDPSRRKKRNLNQFIISACFLALFPSASWAEEAHHQGGTATIRSGQILGQPWEEERGSWRGRVFGSGLESTSAFDGEGRRSALDNNGKFTGWSLNFFGEYALSERWSVSAFLPLQRSSLSNGLASETWTSVGDTYGWAKYRFKNLRGFSQSMVVGAKIPGNYKPVSGIGDKQFDYDAQYLLTKSFTSGNYFSINSGYRVRLGEVSDEAILGAQFGVALRTGWLLIPSLNGVKGIGNGIQKDYLNVGLTSIKTLHGPWSVFASFNKILSGKNTISADVWSLGVSFR